MAADANASELAALRRVTTGLQDFLGAVGAIIGIALGVESSVSKLPSTSVPLCGYPLYRSFARSLGWIGEFRAS